MIPARTIARVAPAPAPPPPAALSPGSAAPLELHLSGPRLRGAFESLVAAAEPLGGVERCIGALALKGALFEEVLGKGRVGDLSEEEFAELCACITPARRRVGDWLALHGFGRMRALLADLLHGWADAATADRRIAAFVGAVGDGKRFRWSRDLAAEVLHFTAPDRYPLMTRWMWDARVGTGVLREIWFADDVDRAVIDAPDGFATFALLREELEGFLAANGVFRDLPFYVDLLAAHVYGTYIDDRGGRFLQTDFAGTEQAPLAHTWRLLGLDGLARQRRRAADLPAVATEA